MNKKNIYLSIIILLLITVPWFFFNSDSTKFYGLPDWGFYSLVFSILFAVVTALLISKYWDKLSDGSEDD